jgi:polyhydroxyalkanoate synthesis regulator protein
MRVFSPFAYARQEGAAQGAAEDAKPVADETSLDDLKRQMEQMQAQIAKLASKE